MDMFNPKNTQAKDFRTVYANTLGFQFSGLELMLRFGILKNIANENDGIDEQVVVAMSSATAKTLMVSLEKIIGQYEQANNVVIPINPSTESTLERAFTTAAKPPKK